MKALAWDDQPEYMELLATYLERIGVRLEIVTSEKAFVDSFFNEVAWDFVVTDLLLENSPVQGEGESVGLHIARRVADSEKGRDLPIFMITEHYDRLNAKDMSLPSTVIVKSKSTYPGWMAGEIRQELGRRGLFVDQKKIFLIYGRDRNADGTRGRVEHFLRGKGVNVVTLGDSPLKVEITQGLITKMNECGAIVAICTPDDDAPEISQPRPNVFLEIGLALGLSRGLQRLILLQKWGPAKEEQAVLPSDLQGILTIRFEGDVENQFNKLEGDLRNLGIEL